MKVMLNHLDTPGMFGMKRYTLELAEGLRNLGVDVRLRANNGLEAGGALVGFVSKAVRNLGPVRRHGADLVHATDHKSNSRPSAEVVTVHDIIPAESPELVVTGAWARPFVRAWDRNAARRALRGARVVLTDTEYVRGQLVRNLGASPDQVLAIPLGVRHDHFYPNPQAGASFCPKMLTVLLAARIDLRKRADLVLAAAARLPFVHVIHVGGDAAHPRGRRLSEAIEADLRILEQEGRWTRLPSLDDATLRELMSRCDVLVHPSAAEGFSLPPLEALACGARVLASDIPPHREVLGDAARFVALDPGAIARELERMWDGEAVQERAFPPQADRLAHAHKFTWERTARRTLAAYESALRSRPASGR